MVTVAKPLAVVSEPSIFVERPLPSTDATVTAHPTQIADRTVTADRSVCPRCDTRLSIKYFEPQCLQCGYVDYTHRMSTRVRKNLVNSGTRYVLRYVGDFPALSETLAHIQLHRLRNRAVYGVSCPFCGRSMVQASLSGKRREVREERYKCMDGHRVSLTPKADGGLGWK